MSFLPLEKARVFEAAMIRSAWRSLQVAAAVAIVVVPFGYAATGAGDDVAMGAFSGLAVGLGLNFRLGARNGRAVGILIGASVGVAVMPFASFIGRGPGFLVAAVLALAVGLMEGLGTSRLRGYRDAVLESLLVSTLLGLGLAFSPLGPNGLVVSLWCVPANAILAGFFSRDSSGRRFARPPNWLLASYLAVFALIVLVTSVERHPHRPLPEALVIAAVTAVLVPVAVFCSAWRLAAWLRLRLRVYLQLADYLR